LDILGKIQTSLAMDHLMPVAVASYLVPARSDVLHQRRISLGHPTQDEEGGVGVGIIKDVEEALRGIDDAARQARPFLWPHGAGEGLGMEVLLDVERQGIAHAHRAPASARPPIGSASVSARTTRASPMARDTRGVQPSTSVARSVAAWTWEGAAEGLGRTPTRGGIFSR